MFAIGPWYWGIGLFVLGLIVSAILFNLARGFFPIEFRLGVVFMGFIGIPATVIGLVYFSVQYA